MNQTTKKHHFSGMLNQHEFKERYIFMMQRVANGFSREDIAFLMGRPPYHIIDYEEFDKKTNLDYLDHEVWSAVFKVSVPGSLHPKFVTKVDKLDISYEKRIVRGIQIESKVRKDYQFIHPWVNSDHKIVPITTTEIIHRDEQQIAEITTFLTHLLSSLINQNISQSKTSPFNIYNNIYKTIPCRWKYCFVYPLRQVVFKMIQTKKLQIKSEKGHFYYQGII